jgi:hypothetical protein
MLFHRINSILLLGVTIVAGNVVIDLKNETSTVTTRHHHPNIRSGGAADDLDILVKEEDHDQQVERETQQGVIGRTCLSIRDCPSGYRCKANACFRDCVTSRDCPSGYSCEVGTCKRVPATIVTCRDSGDCARGFLCNIRKTCVRSNGAGLCGFCRDSRDCASGLRCLDDMNFCVSLGPNPSVQGCSDDWCLSLRDCPSGFRCGPDYHCFYKPNYT